MTTKTDIIPIYSAEAELREKIISNHSIAYVSQLQNVEHSEVPMLFKAQASLEDKDLYYTQSILVTSNWNKNDDVFDKNEVWKAKSTPSHKPTNLNHDEHILVGHITDSWAMDLQGNLIPNNTEETDLPDVFHIVNGAVIYTQWEDNSLIERTQQLISEIEAGKKFVSMECLFTNFDYAVITAEGNHHIVARDEDTAWMTKHLRAYGGTGQYRGARIGRLLKNITFSGKGYVDNPANPDSIIFSKDDLMSKVKAAHTLLYNKVNTNNPFILNNGVYITIEESTTSSNLQNEETLDMPDEKLTELKTALAAAEERAKVAEEALVKADISKLQADLTSKETEIETLKTENAALQAKNDEIAKTNSCLMEELKDIRAKELRANRISTLVDGGIDKEIASTKVDKFVFLNDEQFTEVATELIAAAKAQLVKAEEVVVPVVETPVDETPVVKAEEVSEEEVDSADVVATEDVLETVETVASVDLATPNLENEEINDVRKELAAAIAKRLGRALKSEE